MDFREIPMANREMNRSLHYHFPGLPEELEHILIPVATEEQVAHASLSIDPVDVEGAEGEAAGG